MVDVSTLENGVELRHQQLKLRVETWGENSLRVRASLLEIDEQVWALLEPDEIKTFHKAFQEGQLFPQ